jgi:hypothetical protein
MLIYDDVIGKTHRVALEKLNQINYYRKQLRMKR